MLAHIFLDLPDTLEVDLYGKRVPSSLSDRTSAIGHDGELAFDKVYELVGGVCGVVTAGRGFPGPRDDGAVARGMLYPRFHGRLAIHHQPAVEGTTSDWCQGSKMETA